MNLNYLDPVFTERIQEQDQIETLHPINKKKILRSHAIFTLTVEAAGGANGLTVSKFHLVDLAGSERQKKTKAKVF